MVDGIYFINKLESVDSTVTAEGAAVVLKGSFPSSSDNKKEVVLMSESLITADRVNVGFALIKWSATEPPESIGCSVTVPE